MEVQYEDYEDEDELEERLESLVRRMDALGYPSHEDEPIPGVEVAVDDDELRVEFPWLPVDCVPGRRPDQWVSAEVEEAYIHCSKHIPRLYRHPGDRHHLTHRPAKKTDYFGTAACAVPA